MSLLGAADQQFALKCEHPELTLHPTYPIDWTHIASLRSKQVIPTNSLLYVLIFFRRLKHTIHQQMPHNGHEFGFITGILRAANPLAVFSFVRCGVGALTPHLK